jgi:nuclear transport factor 2 (NTF2) superfamily protein
MTDAARPPMPPFTPDRAAQKARMAEDAWNGRDPKRVSLAYTPDSRWRNRGEFLQGRDAIQAFFTHKWATELDYRLIRKSGPSAGTGSLSGSPTNGTTPVGSGSVPTATRTGASTPTV